MVGEARHVSRVSGACREWWIGRRCLREDVRKIRGNMRRFREIDVSGLDN